MPTCYGLSNKLSLYALYIIHFTVTYYILVRAYALWVAAMNIILLFSLFSWVLGAEGLHCSTFILQGRAGQDRKLCNILCDSSNVIDFLTCIKYVFHNLQLADVHICKTDTTHVYGCCEDILRLITDNKLGSL